MTQADEEIDEWIEMLNRPIWERCDCPHCVECAEKIKSMERGEGMLKAAMRIGEAHLHDKISLLNLIERALVQMKRGRTSEARKFLERAVREVRIGDV